MKYGIVFSKSFKRGLKKYRNSQNVLEKLQQVLILLSKGGNLPFEYKDHKLHGRYGNFRECHLFPDVLLIYRRWEKEREILLNDIGSHSELFG